MSTPNYKYISENYKLPNWFIHNDIDWLRYVPYKDHYKEYARNTERTIKENIKEEKIGLFGYYIYDDEKVEIFEIFAEYLKYINNYEVEPDITNEEIKKLLSIKICDYSWSFMWSEPEYDKNSEELLLQKI